jgi:hypothetical protein
MHIIESSQSYRSNNYLTKYLKGEKSIHTRLNNPVLETLYSVIALTISLS